MSSSEEEVDTTLEELRAGVADIPFEKLAAINEQSLYPRPKAGAAKAASTRDSTKRLNKNRPSEMSSKFPVGRHREVITTSTKEVRDPRFESLCGEFNEDSFSKSYAFLKDLKQSEIDNLKKQVAKAKNKDEKGRLKAELKELETKVKQEEVQETKKKEKSVQKKREMELVSQGKKPFYLKKAESKKLELKKKYQQLQESGRLDSYLVNRRKKHATKDHRLVPYARR